MTVQVDVYKSFSKCTSLDMIEESSSELSLQ